MKKKEKPKKEKPKKQPKKQVVIRNTNTAMGKALAEAFGGVTMEVEPKEKAVATAAVTGLEKRVKDKKKMAEELGIGELTLTDILKELEK